MIARPSGTSTRSTSRKRQVRIARQLERVRQDDEIEAGRVERQGVEVAAQAWAPARRARARRRAVGGSAAPARPADAAATRRRRRSRPTRPRASDAACGWRAARRARQAELQRVEAEQVGHRVVEMALFPREQVLSRRGLQPLGQLYDRAFRHEPDRPARVRRQHLRMLGDGMPADRRRSGRGGPVAEALDARRLELAAILVTRRRCGQCRARRTLAVTSLSDAHAGGEASSLRR